MPRQLALRIAGIARRRDSRIGRRHRSQSQALPAMRDTTDAPRARSIHASPAQSKARWSSAGVARSIAGRICRRTADERRECRCRGGDARALFGDGRRTSVVRGAARVEARRKSRSHRTYRRARRHAAPALAESACTDMVPRVGRMPANARSARSARSRRFQPNSSDRTRAARGTRIYQAGDCRNVDDLVVGNFSRGERSRSQFVMATTYHRSNSSRCRYGRPIRRVRLQCTRLHPIDDLPSHSNGGLASSC